MMACQESVAVTRDELDFGATIEVGHANRAFLLFRTCYAFRCRKHATLL
jgi:hypothetical protein